MTSFPDIHFFYESVIISREHLKQSTCQVNCAYFTTLVATIHYNKRPLVDLRKIEEHVYFRKTIVALLFFNNFKTQCKVLSLNATRLTFKNVFILDLY